MGIKITTDSTCDLSFDLINKNNIKVLPLCVVLENEEYLDGVTVRPEDIFASVSKTGNLPKTAARSIEDFKEFFLKQIEDGSEVVHIGIGSQLSACYKNAQLAISELKTDKVFLVDSCSLSTGIALLLLHASELAQQGICAEKIAKIERKRAKSVQASFVVDKLDYLHKGGRCSTLAKFGANLLNLKPRLQVVDGIILNTEKYRGKMNIVLQKYIDGILLEFQSPDVCRCFITHASAEKGVVEEVVNYVKSKNIFNEVLVTVANGTISCHCGKGTLGILFINDGGEYEKV